MNYINEIREGENVDEIYFVKQYQQLKTKQGKTYGSLTLQDRTGVLDAKIWDFGPAIENFESFDYVHVRGSVTSFQGSLQLSVSKLRRCHEGEYDISEYMPTSSRNIEEMYSSLMKIGASVKEEHLKALIDSFFVSDKDFIKVFKSRSAAKTVHHGFIGGLLEHTLSVTELCEFYSLHYPVLNHDLVVCAAMLHDIGKTRELSDFPLNDYTDEGNPLGHIYIGASMIEERISHIDGFPKALKGEIIHCILAHHGEPEYGSVKKPAIAEAEVLFMADNLDAKMETLKEIFANSDPKAEWLGFSKWLDTNIRRTT